ncbi:helix-turn-helix transcriptional regulator [Desulfobulbus oralis]|nr:helix-turn-helix transcriptional regulator [Desulfobulbus oralis]
MKEDITGSGSAGKLGENMGATLAVVQARVRLEVIRQLYAGMRKLGMGRRELAEKIGRSREEITRLLTGNEPLTLDTLVALAYAVQHGVAIRLWPKDQAEQADEAAMDRTAAAACETTVAMDTLKAANALACADLGDEDAPPGEDGDQDTPVVLAALEEAAGADKSFFEEMWAAVQHETQERALKAAKEPEP